MTTVENQSGLEPVGRAVLCKPFDPELNRTTIAIPDHVKELELMREMRATVVMIGANCWPDEPARCAVGDKVLISKFCGAIIKGPKDGEFYRLVNDNDIFCKITEGSWDSMVSKDPVVKAKEIERTTSSARLAVPTRTLR